MTNITDNTYHSFLSTVLTSGEARPDRTGTGVVGIFDHQMEFDIRERFPLITTKRVHFPSVAHELLWFISGNTNIKYLKDNKVRIWNEWADEQGNLGPVYGKQWRYWENNGVSIDQLTTVINQIKTTPYSRRHIVSAWNVSDLDQMALPPCHLLFQFYVTTDGYLNCKLFQRSADIFLGVPFNIASYSLLTYMVARLCQLKPGKFVWSGTDCHIYQNHIDAVKTQLARPPLPSPTLEINGNQSNIDDFTYLDFQLNNYEYHSAIKADISV